MPPDFTHCQLPVIDKRVHRLGIASDRGLDAKGLHTALDLGANYFFWSPRMKATRDAMQEVLHTRRDEIVLATGPTTAWWGAHVRSWTEKTLGQLGIDHLDVLQVHWVGVLSALSDGVMAELVRLREEGKTRAIGISIHDRPRAGRLAADSELDVLMLRYNAAHPGAEADIFPHLPPGRRSVVAYTATSWRRLLKRPRGWDEAVPTAGQCYRFCLTHPAVNVVLSAPASVAQVQENIAALEAGPMVGEELEWMRRFGAVVHG